MHTVVDRLSELGSTVAKASHHRGLTHVEVAPSGDPFSPVLEVAVESRPAGSYVSAQIAPSGLLRDFGRVVRLFFTLSAVSFLSHYLLSTGGAELIRAGCAIGAGWAGVMALYGALEDRVRVRAAASVDDFQLRQALRRLLGQDA